MPSWHLKTHSHSTSQHFLILLQRTAGRLSDTSSRKGMVTIGGGPDLASRDIYKTSDLKSAELGEGRGHKS